jgi:hypothetical protein
MESTQMIRQIVGFQKTAFDRSFNVLLAFQDQTASITKAFMNQSYWLPEESQKTVDFWIQAIRKGEDEFKRAVDETYSNIDSMIK